MTRIAIATNGLTRDFPSVRAVDDLTFEVPAGIVFGFLGPNGSGKTTTVRILLGLVEPTSGSAEVLGHDIVSDADAVRAASGALMEHAGLYERLSAEENLVFFGRAAGMKRTEIAPRIRELLEPLELYERRGELVGTWSRGMKQRLAVVRALIHRPRMLFLDEPTAGLDPIAAADLRDDLERLVREQGVTVFINTHHLAEAERLCDLVGVIRRGRLIAFGHPDEVRGRVGKRRLEIVGTNIPDGLIADLAAHPSVEAASRDNGRVRLDLTADALVPPLVRLLVERGADIEEVRRGTESLEEAFLALLEGADEAGLEMAEEDTDDR